MPLDLTCPSCQAPFPVAEARHTVAVECPWCGAALAAEFRAPGSPEPPVARVTRGFPPFHAAFAPLANAREGNARSGTPPAPGFAARSVAVLTAALILSAGGLGATGYFLFQGGDSATGNSRPPRPAPDSSPPPALPDPPPPAKRSFELKPVYGQLPSFKIAYLPHDPMAVDLRQYGRLGSVAVGGGGRYFVLHYPDTGTLQVFDAVEPKTISRVTIEAGERKVAAGASLVVTSPAAAGGGAYQVFSLPGLERRPVASDALLSGVTALAMGSRTNGPLLAANAAGEVALFDVGAGGLTEVEGSRQRLGVPTGSLRAYPGGSAFVAFADPTHGVRVLTEARSEWRVNDLPGATPVPGADGNYYGNGPPVDRTGRPLDVATPCEYPPGRVWVLPQVTRPPKPNPPPPFTQQGYLVKVVATPPAVPGGNHGVTATVHWNGNLVDPHPKSPVITNVPELEGLLDPDGALKPTVDQHFFLVPEARVLVVVAADRTKLLVYRFNT